MMRPTQCLRLFALLSLFAIASCRKESADMDPVHRTDTLSQQVYSVTRSPEASYKGYILASPFGYPDLSKPGHLMVFDGDGHLLQRREVPTAAMNFRRWEIGGKLRYTWVQYDNSFFTINGAGHIVGYAVIADEHLNEIRRVNLLPHGNIRVSGNQSLDGHEFILLSDNHYILMSYYRKEVRNIPSDMLAGGSATVVAPVIQEVRNGLVIFQWDGTDHPEFYAASVEGNNYSDPGASNDYMHLNSIFIDPRDRHLICSFRNTDQVVKINRQTGAVIWRLGGKDSDFPLTEDQKFLRQHHATLADDNQSLLIFDNGDSKLRASSRIIEIQLDEAARQVSSYKSFSIPAPFSMYMGSVQKLEGHYFIGGGTGNYILDIDPASGAKRLELTGDMPTYRAYRY